MKRNFRICRRVYQSLFVEVAITFIQYINMLMPNEIEQLGNDLKANSENSENSVELWVFFKCFFYCNGRFPLTNRLLSVSDGEIPPGSERISLKLLYEMLKDTKSRGLVSLQFYRHLTFFWWRC